MTANEDLLIFEFTAWHCPNTVEGEMIYAWLKE